MVYNTIFGEKHVTFLVALSAEMSRFTYYGLLLQSINVYSVCVCVRACCAHGMTIADQIFSHFIFLVNENCNSSESDYRVTACHIGELLHFYDAAPNLYTLYRYTYK